MTEEQLRKIEARAAAATKGPWFKHGMFIAQSREDVPALVAEVRRLQAENVQMWKVLRSFGY